MKSLSSEISGCRICNSSELSELINFGELALTGVFMEEGDKVPSAPLRLIRCETCNLVQLGHNYNQDFLYGNSYGYESHLNSSMVRHLQQKARVLEARFLKKIINPIVVDIASNDGTLLSGYKRTEIKKVGIDPLISLVQNHYPDDAIKIMDFFSSSSYFKAGLDPANLVTSLSVIYDLEKPIDFARQVYEILADNGIWHFEQSYLPLMIDTNSYDTICHEHLLYLSLEDIERILNAAKFQIIEASVNSINGGSIAVTAIKSQEIVSKSPFVDYLIEKERKSGISDGKKLVTFASEYLDHVSDLRSLLSEYKSLGYEIFGLGASTKGNVLLQVLGIDKEICLAIGEVNPRKYGKQTPGSSIPIIPESSILTTAADKSLIVVLPWHFRENLLPKLETYLSRGGKLLFPLPRIEIVSG